MIKVNIDTNIVDDQVVLEIISKIYYLQNSV